MKKKREIFSPFGDRMRLRIRRMKLTVLMIFLVMASFGNSFSQVTLSLHFDKANIHDVLGSIEQKTDYIFLYKDDILNGSKEITIDFKDAGFEEVLKAICDQSNIDFEVREHQIILKEKAIVPMTPEQQQSQKKRSISGNVTDEKGQPLPGVSVVVKGTTTGTITDSDGNFTLQVIPAAKELVLSFVGMKKVEIAIGGKSTINMTLVEDVVGLEDVVAVGYGTQRKANLTGSVASVNAQELSKRPAANVQNLLQGKVSGLQVTQNSAKPGDDGATMRIRGYGTFSSSGSDPLVLVNGVQGDLTNLDPNDIESVSVLKDAASGAIYGARAANGVILVTTKKGKAEALTIEYHTNFQAQEATRLPKLLTNSADYMTYWNQARIRGGATPYFAQADIDAYRNSNDPVKYPNFNWIDYMFHTGYAQNHHLNVSGGNEKTTFNMSLGYLDQSGIAGIYDFKKYNVLLSVDSKVKDWIAIGGNIQMVKKDILESNYNESDEFILGIYGSGPNYTPTFKLPDGSTGYAARYSSSIGEWTVRNPESISASGALKQNRYNVSSQFHVDIKLSKDLMWYSKGAVGFDNNFSKLNEHSVNNYYFKDGTYAHNNGTWHLGVNDNMTQNLLTTLYSTLNYNKLINGVHNVSAMAGYNQESNFYRRLQGARTTFPTYTIIELAAGSALNQTTYGTANEWAIQSLFGRLSYDYKGKYLLEANARYDGTSRISSDNRWGLFPSLSSAWRLSQESFMKKYRWIDNMKLRASWGKLGNQNVGLYPYQELLTTTSYPFNALNPAVVMSRLVDKNLKWETTTVTDFGVDLSVKNGLFSLTADWFNKVTDDILYNIPVPASVGLLSPTVNYGKMKNTGWEFEVGHANKVGEFKYNISFNLTTIKNEVLRVLTPSYGGTIIKEGLPFNSFYLTQFDGIFQNQAEIDAAPKHPFNPKPGDLKYKDQNGDGIIDAKDRVVVDGAYPKFYYGGSLNLSWKNFDFTAFFQGVAGQKFYVGGSGWGLSPFVQGSAPRLDFIKNMWTGEGSTNSQPAMYYAGYQPVTGTASTFWLLNSSYLRLKNIAIGYNLPKKLTQKIGLKDIRVYMSGDNLVTITKYPGADPEGAASVGRFSAYPQVAIYTLGVKVKL